jgi:hypothetical protein
VGMTGSQYRNFDAAFGTILIISKGFHIEGSKNFTFILYIYIFIYIFFLRQGSLQV